MTDKDILFNYRMQQAERTLRDAEQMLQNNLSPHSIINRAYYSAFYAVLALFLKTDTPLKTSKHYGVISLFDKNFVHAGRIGKHYSELLHKMAELRQVADYKEYVEISSEDAAEYVRYAQEFLDAIKTVMGL
jgi:uncharacterized protein (UPF0332 family)